MGGCPNEGLIHGNSKVAFSRTVRLIACLSYSSMRPYSHLDQSGVPGPFLWRTHIDMGFPLTDG